MAGEIDRSQSKENTVQVRFESGPIFRVPAGLTIREAAAYLLTPDVDTSAETVLTRIHSEGEDWAKHGREPGFEIYVNGTEADFETELTGDSPIEVEIKDK